MGKPTEFGQFDQGAGQAYAPKTPRATKPAEPFAEPKSAHIPEEMDMIDTLRAERRMVPINRSSQSTDHMQ